MPKLLGLDIGTSATKAVLIDKSGSILASASAEYPIHTPRPGWSEQDPDDWWKAASECITAIGEIPDAIGLTGQMHGSVFLDKAGKVIRPALLWNDQRTVRECELMEQRIGIERLLEITCNPPMTGFQAPKVLWLREHEPENFERLHSVLLPKDYVRFRLTGERITDVSDASGTGVFDVPNRTWSSELLQALGLDPDLFPLALESYSLSAQTDSGARVIAGAGDQAAAAVGTGAVTPQVVSVSLGTSGVVFTALSEARYLPDGGLNTFCHANGAWHAMGVMLSCGGAVRWFRDVFAADSSFDELASLAQGSAPGARGCTFLPYLAGERCPHNDPGARGSFTGLSLATTREDLARSVFEGVSFGLLDALDLVTRLGTDPDEVRITGGGARSSFWVQMLADIFKKPCKLMKVDEGPAFGAAILAGVGLGVWSDVVEASQTVVEASQTFEPSTTDYEEALRRYRSLYPRMFD
jgi:xylulokinase